MAIVDIADGRESSFSDVMRDPVDIREGADTRISFDCPPQSRKLPAHAEGFCYRKADTVIPRQTLEKRPILFGFGKSVPPERGRNPICIGVMKLAVALSEPSPARGIYVETLEYL